MKNSSGHIAPRPPTLKCKTDWKHYSLPSLKLGRRRQGLINVVPRLCLFNPNLNCRFDCWVALSWASHTKEILKEVWSQYPPTHLVPLIGMILLSSRWQTHWYPASNVSWHVTLNTETEQERNWSSNYTRCNIVKSPEISPPWASFIILPFLQDILWDSKKKSIQ